ncbi:hypothetical protein ACFPRL_07420 [Pseudoclavibacter helvolus]
MTAPSEKGPECAAPVSSPQRHWWRCWRSRDAHRRRGSPLPRRPQQLSPPRRRRQSSFLAALRARTSPSSTRQTCRRSRRTAPPARWSS